MGDSNGGETCQWFSFYKEDYSVFLRYCSLCHNLSLLYLQVPSVILHPRECQAMDSNQDNSESRRTPVSDKGKSISVEPDVEHHRVPNPKLIISEGLAEELKTPTNIIQ